MNAARVLGRSMDYQDQGMVVLLPEAVAEVIRLSQEGRLTGHVTLHFKEGRIMQWDRVETGKVQREVDKREVARVVS